ncbi:hypothetical protein NL676_021725 [Syzygium grande]|nr:hypothetical protein NL676_021725 [Syzygium grande]
MPCATPRAFPLCVRLFLFCLVCCPFIPSVAPLSFNITSFDTDLRDILYEGVATATYGYVDLTTGNPHHYQVGRIKYANPIRIWDPLTGRQADFSTNFSFTIDTHGSAQYSDGLAFFLAPVGTLIPPNSAGGFLGLFNASTANEGHRNRIVMVEFDTFVNREFDPLMHHIGINENHLKSLVSKPWDPALHSGKAILVLVTYNSTSKNLTVLWSFDGKPPSQDKTYPSLSSLIDLARVLPESVEIGFSASFGYHPERHSINSWEFTSNLDDVDPLLPDRSPPKGVNSKPRRLRILVVVPVACFLLVISAGSCFFVVKRSEKHGYDPARRPRAGQVISFLRLEDSVPELPRGAFDNPVSYRPSASQLGMLESPSAPIQESVSINEAASEECRLFPPDSRRDDVPDNVVVHS